MTESTRPPRRVLGDILVECRVVTQSQVEAALAEQRRSGKLFGEALLDLGFISEDDLGWALSAQLNVPYIDLNADMVDKGAVRLIGPELMRRDQLLPLVRVGDALTIVMADPTDDEAVNDVENATGMSVQISIASPRRVARIIEEILGPEERVHESSDILFREITRPYLVRKHDGPGRPNPLGVLFSTALQEKVREIHFDPSPEDVRVRFRRGRDLKDETRIHSGDFNAIVRRLKESLDPAEENSGRAARWTSRIPFATAALDLTVTVLPGLAGDSLILEMCEVPRPASIDDLSLSPATRAALRRLLDEPQGLIIATGPGAGASRAMFESMVRSVNSDSRRVLAHLHGSTRDIKGVFLMKTTEDPVRENNLTRFLAASTYADVLCLDELAAGPDFDLFLDAAGNGRLVLARIPAPDAASCLSLLIERGASRTLLRKNLAAIVEAAGETVTSIDAAILTITEPLAEAMDRRAGPAELEKAAWSGGFCSVLNRKPTGKAAA